MLKADTFVLDGEKINRHARCPDKSAFAPVGQIPDGSYNAPEHPARRIRA